MPKALPETAEDEDSQRDRYLIFSLGEEVYGIEIKYVTEIVGLQKITSFPDSPDYMKGVINLRGNLIPIVDMRLRLRKESVPYTDRTSIIVISIGESLVGLIVDRVKEVLSADGRSISPPPDFKAGLQSRYIKGIGKSGSVIWLLLNCERLVSLEDMRVQDTAGE